MYLHNLMHRDSKAQIATSFIRRGEICENGGCVQNASAVENLSDSLNWILSCLLIALGCEVSLVISTVLLSPFTQITQLFSVIEFRDCTHFQWYVSS